MKLNRDHIFLDKAKKFQLKAIFENSDSQQEEVVWSTDNNQTATVSNGMVTARSVGTAKITAKTSSGKTAVCIVTVTQPTVYAEGISLNKTQTTIVSGNTEVLTAAIMPSDVTDVSLTWTSSNEKVATVTAGVIKAHSQGVAAIR